ncbi:MAG: AMP-binding protein, partial [Muribaculaceae bacterium]|nr:AMP-binding protein [Muribaculaceae bacterium]
ILSEDFETAVEHLKNGKTVKLPEKTASFIEWSRKLKDYGENISKREREYWNQEIAKTKNGRIVGDYSEDKPGAVMIEFSRETTEKLLTKSENIYGARIDEVMIAGLARAVGRITGQSSIAVKLEGHGREALHEPIEVDRTLGWFTNIYGVNVAINEDSRESILNAKEAMRKIPGGGLGCSFAGREFESDISFNYLGDFSGSEGSFFGEYSCGDDIAAGNRTNDRIALNGQVSDGKLIFAITSEDSSFGEHFIEMLAYEYKKSITELAEYCAEAECREKTASDYGVYDLTIEEFNDMKTGFEGEAEKIYGLTPLQTGMLFHNIEDRESTGYVLQSVYRIGFEMDSEMLKEALRLLSIRYEILRTSFVYEKVSDPKQIVYAEREPEYEIIKVAECDISRIKSEDLKRGFDLKRDRLLRVKYIKTEEKGMRLIWTMHHIIVDGWCLGVLFGKLMKYYDQLEKGVSIAEIETEIGKEREQSGEYSEYIEWQKKQDTEKALNYWKEELDGYESDCEIAAMRKPEPTEEQIRIRTAELCEEVTEKLKKLAESSKSTINTAAETAVGIMLQAYSGSRDVVFGKVVSGRNADIRGIEDMVGIFINTIPVRVTAENGTTVAGLVAMQQEKGTESTSYDYCSLAEIQGLTAQGSELIKVLYVFENYESGAQSGEDANGYDITMESAREQTNYGISIMGYENRNRLCFNVMYDPNKYCEEEIDAVLDRLVKICEEMANKPNGLVSELETVTEKEKQHILVDFNSTDTDYPKDKTIVELFEEQASKTPNNTAVVFEEEKLTYAELNAKANSLAHKLRELGVKPDDFVAIIADRSIEMIAGIYGIIKSGGAYVPIDPTYPEDRIAFML